MKNQKFFIRVAVIVFALVCIFCFPQKAQAASKLTQLKANKTYTVGDLNRDGHKDKVRIKYTETYAADWETRVKVYVNGKYKFTAEGCKGCTIYVATTGSKSVILSDFVYGDGGDSFYAWNYKSGKYQSVQISPSYTFYTSNIKFKGNTLYLFSKPKMSSWYPSLQLIEDISYSFRDSFTIKNGVLKRTSNKEVFCISTTVCVVDDLTTSTSITKWNSKGVNLREGDKVTIKKVYYNQSDNTLYYYVTKNGKSGWVKDSSQHRFMKWREYAYSQI